MVVGGKYWLDGSHTWSHGTNADLSGQNPRFCISKKVCMTFQLFTDGIEGPLDVHIIHVHIQLYTLSYKHVQAIN